MKISEIFSKTGKAGQGKEQAEKLTRPELKVAALKVNFNGAIGALIVDPKRVSKLAKKLIAEHYFLLWLLNFH